MPPVSSISQQILHHRQSGVDNDEDTLKDVDSKIDATTNENDSLDYHENFESPTLITAILSYIMVALLQVFGYLNDYLHFLGLLHKRIRKDPLEKLGFTSLFNDFESFYTRNFYRRVRDCWNRPIGSCPGPVIDLIERESKNGGWTFQNTGRRIRTLNVGSYNYLGFAETNGPCAKAACEAIREQGIGIGSSQQEVGLCETHQELDDLVAQFLGVEAAVTFAMGFATNALNMPSIIGKGCLILSDEFNHCSLILGSRLSGATIETFKHGDLKELETKIRNSIINGHPRTRRPWKKIFIVVEGIYSMEGSTAKLPDLIHLKKKYNCYLYLDEAHSIGAIGRTGRGITEYFGCDTKDIDILMGTFTKSFGAAGGYIAGSKKLIDFIRATSHATVYGGPLSTPVALQVITALRIIMGLDDTIDGQRRIQRLAWNTQYFRYHLHRMGFIVYGSQDSPIVPVLLPIGLMGFFSREMLKRHIAVVVVGYPATPLTVTRVRFCLSAAHTKLMLDRILTAIDEISKTIKFIKNSSQPPGVLKELESPPPKYDNSLLTSSISAMDLETSGELATEEEGLVYVKFSE